MIQILNKLPCGLNRSILQYTIRSRPAISVLALQSRFKTTHSTKKSQNLQQKVLKLEKTEECPPKQAHPETTSSKAPPASSNSTASSSTPPPESPNNFTKWIVIGGAIAAGAGFMFYKNSLSTDESSIAKKSDSKKEEKKEEKVRYPPTLKDIPHHIPYLLIGGGTASFAAFRAIKSNEPRAKILVISDELKMPYMRPPLSKEIWFDTQLGVEKGRFKQWNGAERSLYYEPEEFYMSAEKLGEAENGGVSVIRGYSVTKLNVKEQKVLLDDGTVLSYDKCLLATGSSPKTVDIFRTAPLRVREKIYSYKSIKDFEEVKKQVEKSKTVAVVGSGFLGSELSCALAHHGEERGLKVYQLFHENGNMAKILPSYLSKWTTERIREVGVDVQPSVQITDVELYEGNQLKLKLMDGRSIIVDTVIQAVGSTPNVSLAKEAELELDPKQGGLTVNAELSARSNLYVAGDIACFYDPKLGRRRVEHHDHAVVSGRLAGENMVGLKKPYKHQSMFWSDLGTAVGYEAIGLVDSTLPTVGVFAKFDPNEEKRLPYTETESEEAEPSSESPKVDPSSLKDCPPSDVSKDSENYGKGVLFYMQDDRIVGILLWNVFNRISIARKILASDETFKDLNEVAKLFDIYDQQSQDKQN